MKSMSSPGSIQEWPLEGIPKYLETAFLWEHTVDSIESLCNNGVHRQNLDTTEIWDGGVLPEIFAILILEKGVYYNRKSIMWIGF